MTASADGPRVLHALHSFPPFSHGGIETYVARLTSAQRASGVRPIILAGCDHGPREPVLRDERVGPDRVLRLRPAPRSLSESSDNSDLRDRFVPLLQRERVDLLHVHHWHNLSGNLVAMARGVGVPAIVTLHDHFASCPRFFRLRGESLCAPAVEFETCVACVGELVDATPAAVTRAMRRRVAVFRTELELAAGRFALSSDQVDSLRGVPALAGLDVVALDLPQPDIVPTQRHLPRPDGLLEIVTWGGLVEGKGLHLLVQACAALRGAERVLIHHYGRVLDPDYVGRVRAAVGACALTVHGPFDGATMEHDLPRHDLAVFPTFFRETHGYVVDEAIALGLPVVISDRGAPVARIGSRGVTFPAGDAPALTTIIQRFLDHPETLAALRAAPPPARHSLAAHWAALQQHYAHALG